jgi:uncharacterized protein
MKLAGDYLFVASVQEVWDALFDPEVLAAVLPGCEKLELVDGRYVGEMKIKIGPVQGTFTGKVDLQDKVEPESYKMIIDGRGGPGFVQATATVALEPDGDGRTRIRYDADAKIGGKIATVGQRLVDASARAIVKQSLEALHENIKIRAEAYKARAEAEEPPAEEEAGAPVEEDDGAPPDAEPPDAAAEPPRIAYKQASASALAGGVAREVLKTIAPLLVVVVAILALVTWWILR